MPNHVQPKNLHQAITIGLERAIRDFGVDLTDCTPSTLTGHVIRELKRIPGWRPPARIIKTPEELDALQPAADIIRGRGRVRACPYRRHRQPRKRDRPVSINPWEIACPACPATAGQRCHIPTWPPTYHPEREAAANEDSNRKREPVSDHTTETIRYAIQLPNGNLSEDIESHDVHDARYTTLPNGEMVWLWESPEGAQAERLEIARKIGYGIGDLFEEKTGIVEVRITETMTITPVDIDGSHE